MNPNIDGSEFGSITIAGRRIENDVMIRLDGTVSKRQKKLSKADLRHLARHLAGGSRGHLRQGRRTPDHRRRPQRDGQALGRGRGLFREKEGQGRTCPHAGGDRALEQGEGQGDRAVSCDLLRAGRSGPWQTFGADHGFIRPPDSHGQCQEKAGLLPAFFIFASFPRSTAAISPSCAAPDGSRCRRRYPDSARCCRCPDPSAIRPGPGGRTGPGRRCRCTCRPCWRRRWPSPAAS